MMKRTMSRLQKKHEEYMTRVKANGGETTFYGCPHCKSEVETRVPTKALVSSKGFWDSLSVCPLCEHIHHLQISPSGNIKISSGIEVDVTGNSPLAY